MEISTRSDALKSFLPILWEPVGFFNGLDNCYKHPSLEFPSLDFPDSLPCSRLHAIRFPTGVVSRPVIVCSNWRRWVLILPATLSTKWLLNLTSYCFYSWIKVIKKGFKNLFKWPQFLMELYGLSDKCQVRRWWRSSLISPINEH